LRKAIRKYVTWYLVVAMLVIGITPRVYAGFSPSEATGLSPAERSSDLRKIQTVLQMKMVGERLKEFGLTPDEVQARLNNLNDQQIHQLALKVDELKAGGDSGLGVIIALLLILILVVLILQLTGHRIVVK